MKISASNFKSFFALLTMFAMSSCGLFNGDKYERKSFNHGDALLSISENNATSGDVILPSDVKLTYTRSKLNEAYLDGHKYIPSPIVGEEAKTIKVLVPLIHFSDSAIISSVSRAKVEEKIRAAFEGENPFLSVKEFYKKASNNLINFEFEYTDWFDGGNSSSCRDEVKTFSIIDQAVRNGTIDGSAINTKDFDSNNDGYIDAVYAIYDVHNCQNFQSDNENLWAYTFDNANAVANKSKPNARNFSWASYDFLDEGYGEVLSDPHTLIHETGHLFGLWDYYDYNANVSPVCALDMMDYNVCDDNAYSKMTLGRMNPYIVYGNATINLNELKNSNSCVVILSDKNELTLEKSSNKYLFNPFNEYMLVEYFDFSSKANYVDLVSGYEPVKLEGNKSYTKSGFKMYHINSPQLFIDGSNVEKSHFYYSNEYVESKNSYLQNIISNTTKGEKKRAESDYFEILGLKSIDAKFDYFNEITLIAKETKHQNSYDHLYVYLDENSEKKIENPDNNFLFNKGDLFVPFNYKNYFVHGNKSNSINFDNNETFSTQINFN